MSDPSNAQLHARVPHSVRERAEEIAEEEGMSLSAATRLLVREGIASIEEDDAEDQTTAPARSVSAVTILGVVALAVGPTLLATGYINLGSAVGAVGAVYALLWVTAYDLTVAEALDDARAELEEVGGVVGFFREMMVKWRSEHPVEEPETPVERAAHLNLYARVLTVTGLLVLVPLGAFYLLGGSAIEFIEIAGTYGALAYVGLAVGLFYAAVLLMGIAALATIAIATAREPSPGTADDEEGVDA